MTSYVAFIPYRLVGAYMLMGWRLCGPLLDNHGRYSVLMEAQ